MAAGGEYANYFQDHQVLQNVTETGITLGTGSFGTVIEVKYGELRCAAKRMHDRLFDVNNLGIENVVQRYADECKLLSQLQHPNITQFLGIWFAPNSDLPLLVMERLLVSLSDLLESVPAIVLSLKLSFLHDVCVGLDYLHTRNPTIIHRDLTASNVLLNSSLDAKLSDLGNSRIVELKPGQSAHTLSQAPGTLAYMPPEALNFRSRYALPLDIFSFGHLSLVTLTQVLYPEILPPTFPDEDSNQLRPRSEVERRQDCMKNLDDLFRGPYPDLYSIVENCLHNLPKSRPTSSNLLTRLDAVKREVDMLHGGSVMKPVSVGRVLTEWQLRKKDKEIDTLTKSKEKLDSDNKTLKKKLEEKEKDFKSFQEMQKSEQQQKDKKIKEYEERLQKSEEYLRIKEDELAEMRTKLQELSLEHTLHRSEVSYMPQEISRSQGKLEIVWKQCPSMPFGIADYIQSVLIDNALYVGSGWSRKRDDNNYLVLRYDMVLSSWRQLRYPYTFRDFAMVAIKKQLVLVGGCDRNNKDSNQLGMLNPSDSKWSQPYAPMPTARHNASAVCYIHWLIVAGGLCQNPLTTVEILDINTNQWSSAGSAPIACHSMKSVMVGTRWYLMGGYEQSSTTNVYEVSLSGLIARSSTTQSSTTASLSEDVWGSIAEVGCRFSTPVCINNTLYAVGGKGEVSSSAILCYSSRRWVEAGQLSAPVYNCTSVFSDGQLIVVGGTCGSKSTETFVGSVRQS